MNLIYESRYSIIFWCYYKENTNLLHRRIYLWKNCAIKCKQPALVSPLGDRRGHTLPISTNHPILSAKNQCVNLNPTGKKRHKVYFLAFFAYNTLIINRCAKIISVYFSILLRK